MFYHPFFIFMFLFLVNSLSPAEIASKRGRQIKIKMVSITSLHHDLNLHFKNVHHSLDNNFFDELFYFFFKIPGDIGWFVHRPLPLIAHFFSHYFFPFFSKLGSSVLVMHISEIFPLTLLPTHKIFEHNFNSPY